MTLGDDPDPLLGFIDRRASPFVPSLDDLCDEEITFSAARTILDVELFGTTRCNTSIPSI